MACNIKKTYSGSGSRLQEVSQWERTRVTRYRPKKNKSIQNYQQTMSAVTYGTDIRLNNNNNRELLGQYKELKISGDNLRKQSRNCGRYPNCSRCQTLPSTHNTQCLMVQKNLRVNKSNN
ncbi:hypothetical protein TOT_010000529 [Theileria orientalis strain Shintoku]|uniref:Uncharacterized protein n=1 Tax=Theileria orientalis strain Shintoku TaxID=869250 RepID=J4C2P8_THEOR|nr:LOW QUALITY PROTEIN: hypothetical protein TOT_010000529 [Theileria orientalis strain Shintoku]BAM39066.1 hypothetical protein TOT_010000529 [Theileria orientalis strain Shintoku]|eukprot:XP_009689367.1 LOW QUALITY PROTEIN: hypothetical protein TOT_010000529 [Theileria orientalis strain Shintoku]